MRFVSGFIYYFADSGKEMNTARRAWRGGVMSAAISAAENQGFSSIPCPVGRGVPAFSDIQAG
jgi:hypothetical protein